MYLIVIIYIFNYLMCFSFQKVKRIGKELLPTLNKNGSFRTVWEPSMGNMLLSLYPQAVDQNISITKVTIVWFYWPLWMLNTDLYRWQSFRWWSTFEHVVLRETSAERTKHSRISDGQRKYKISAFCICGG